MVLARLATVSPATLVKPDHLLCYGIGWAGRGFPGFLSSGQPSLAGLTGAFGPGFDPDLPWSDRALDGRD